MQGGSALFAAPELLLNSHEWQDEGRAGDLWSCGVVLFVMLFGCHPFLREEEKGLASDELMVALMQRTLQGHVGYPPNISSSVSPGCLDILGRLFQPDPKQRIDMQGLLRHPWFVEVGAHLTACLWV